MKSRASDSYVFISIFLFLEYSIILFRASLEISTQVNFETLSLIKKEFLPSPQPKSKTLK
jgi:hypothetical protein